MPSPASDYDCAGCSGNGPKYAHGPSRVTGSDPYDKTETVTESDDDVSEAAGCGAFEVAVGRVGYGGHETNSREFVDGSLASWPAIKR